VVSFYYIIEQLYKINKNLTIIYGKLNNINDKLLKNTDLINKINNILLEKDEHPPDILSEKDEYSPESLSLSQIVSKVLEKVKNDLPVENLIDLINNEIEYSNENILEKKLK
jgi:hypothetical protein